MSANICTLEVDSVILEFGSKRVLQDVYLKCETNRITGLLGRNGTGKSCLLNIMFGTLKPLNGMVRINNEALLDSARKPADLMYLPQFGFIPMFLTLKRIFKDFKLDFFKFTDEFPEFKKHYHSRIGRLSGGERRIVEIYLIIASETKFCLLDESFSHVMPLHIDRIKNLIKKEKSTKGIIVTDHLYEHIIDLCDEIYVLKDGETHLINRVEEIESLGYARIAAKNSDS
jgi:ABC-type multidrug transport system ATPase subunit